MITYRVDGRNRRVAKYVNGTFKRGWLYQDGLRVVGELDSLGILAIRYVYGSRAHVPDYMIRYGKKYRLIADQLGSVRMVVDTADVVIAELDYDAWGKVTKNTSPGFVSLGFAGGLYDHHTGLVRFGARDYDAAVGRWTCRDPIGFAGGSTHLYEYCASDPTNIMDPMGLAGSSVGACFDQFLGSPDDPFSIRGILVNSLRGIAAYRDGLFFSTTLRDQGWYSDDGTGLGVSRGIGNATSAIGAFITGAAIVAGGSAARILGYTKHGIDQAVGRDGGRGVHPAAILDAVRNPKNVIQQGGATTRYVGADATVVLNNAGQIVTTWGRPRDPMVGK